MSQPKKRIRLGDLLVEHEIITEAQLQTALKEQKQRGLRLGRMLMELGYTDEETILNLLSRQLQLPFVDLNHFRYDAEVAKGFPETQARRHRAMMLSESDQEALIGMADPTDIFAQDEIEALFNKPVRFAIVREDDVMSAIDSVYQRASEINTLAEELGEELSETDFDMAQLVQEGQQTDAPVVRLLTTLFESAVTTNASDIHIEPDERELRIRQRIDGVLHEQVMKEKRIAAALVSRLKLMGGLNISEKRLPQDGRFNMKVKGQNIDIRLSTMPVQYGESVVMRLLNQSSGMLNLEQIGMPEDLLERFRKLIHQPYGMVLVTGPTGSGKTTTLYGALNELNSANRKIITAEDPVEYRLPRISQVQVNPQIGLSFASILRTALRQDPDIVLVGEMRDQETAEIGIRAAMTGHFVLSTLHTNDAVTTAVRLIDMGVEGFLVATALKGIVGQRLVRRICENCREEQPLEEVHKSWLAGLEIGAEEHTYYRGRGCARCGQSGYKGRVGVYELLELDATMMDALRRNDSGEFTRLAHARADYRSLLYAALEYAQQGITTLDEMVRISGESPEQLNQRARLQAPKGMEMEITPSDPGDFDPPATEGDEWKLV